MRRLASGAAKRLALEILGWAVLVLGVLALFLPGPGLLLTFAALAILSTQYTWARRLMMPVRVKAWRGAAEGVETVPRIVLSTLSALAMLSFGIYWLTDPAVPSWWPVNRDWWLFGGPAVGWTVIGSAIIALGLLVFAVHRFYRQPDAVEAIERLEEVHRARVATRREARRRLKGLKERQRARSGEDEPRARSDVGTEAQLPARGQRPTA